MDPGQAEVTSIRRRLWFAGNLQYRIDRLCAFRGVRRRPFFDRLHRVGLRVFDRMERLRLGSPAPYRGQPYVAALHADMRVPQDPRYLNYWYDAERHSMVGIHLGLDLLRNDGRFYVVECNYNAALEPLRELFPEPIDPHWTALAEFAQGHGFERIVLCRRKWNAATIQEMAEAARQSGVALVAATVPTWLGRQNPEFPVVNPLYALPRPLAPRTMYVMFSRMTETPLSWFVHNKAWSGRWLSQTLQAHPSPSGLLDYIPTYDRLVVPELLPDPRWPNLVVKLTELDQTRGVAMGRFASEAEARQALQVDDTPGAVPGIFGDRGRGRTVIYQPFVPPEVVGGRALKHRLLTFVSPLGDVFLSGTTVYAAREPMPLPMGLVPDPKAYAVSFAGGGRHERANATLEQQMRTMTEEFGRVVRHAIGQRFEVGDIAADETAGTSAAVPGGTPVSSRGSLGD